MRNPINTILTVIGIVEWTYSIITIPHVLNERIIPGDHSILPYAFGSYDRAFLVYVGHILRAACLMTSLWLHLVLALWRYQIIRYDVLLIYFLFGNNFLSQRHPRNPPSWDTIRRSKQVCIAVICTGCICLLPVPGLFAIQSQVVSQNASNVTIYFVSYPCSQINQKNFVNQTPYSCSWM